MKPGFSLMALLPATLSIWPALGKDELSNLPSDTEDTESVLAERDDLRAQLAAKNTEFLAQHRRADELVKEVFKLRHRLDAEEAKELVLEGKLGKVRALLADDDSGAATAAAAALASRQRAGVVGAKPSASSPIHRTAKAKGAPKASAAAQSRAAAAQARAATRPGSAARGQAAGPAQARSTVASKHKSPVARPRQQRQVKPRKASFMSFPTEIVAEAQEAAPQVSEGKAEIPAHRAAGRPASAPAAKLPEAPRGDAPRPGGPEDSDFRDLEVQLKDEDSKIDELDKDAQEVDAGAPQYRAAPAAVGPSPPAQAAPAAQAAAPAGQDAGRGPGGVGDEDLEMPAEGDQDTEGDAAFLAQLVKQ